MNETIILSLLTASISFTVTETKVFRPLREWVKGKNTWAGDLFSCGYCLGHWIAFAAVAVYPTRLLYGWGLLDYFLTALIIAWLAGIQWIIMCLLFARAGK
jgi:hypothetical protein